MDKFKKRIQNVKYLILIVVIVAASAFVVKMAANWFYKDVGGNATRIPVFVYHRFCSNEEYDKLKSAKSLTISKKKLEEQMKFLHDNGYTTIGMKEFEEWYEGKKELPRKTVMITIDDGKYSAVKYALPVFEKYHIKSTTFIIGNRTEKTTDTTKGKENENSIGFDVLEDLKKNHPDFDTQSHTYSMHKWDEHDSPKIYNYTAAMCAEDLKKQEELFGFDYLAYPFGAYTDLMINEIKTQGKIKLAFTYGNNTYATREQDRYKIERIKVDGRKDLAEFTAWLDEGYPIQKSLTTDFVRNDNFDKVNNTITFASVQGDEYVIMRKRALQWEDIAVIKGGDQETEWTDKNVDVDKKYKYSVKRVLARDSKGNIVATTPCDERGLETLNKVVNPKVDYTNLRARITFLRNIGVTGYKVYRKYGDSDYELLENKKQRKWPIISYSDVFKQSCSEGAVSSRITFKNFIDPSQNDLVYTARPFIKDKKRGTVVMGPMFEDGDFRIADPTIVDVNIISSQKASVRFATVPNAKNYILYSGKEKDGEVEWKKCCEVKPVPDVSIITTDIECSKGDDCFTVQAEFEKNGETLLSGMEENYTIKYRDEAKGKRILVIGASGSYGCPYKRKEIRFVFSYPYRMANMLGAEIVNPSIPGATYSLSGENRAHILTDVVEKVEKGEEVSRDAYPYNVLDRNLQLYKLTDFDIVLVVAGGNDYNSNLEPGDVYSTDKTTFAGAINTIMDKLSLANEERVKTGKKETTVIMVGTTYSDRRSVFAELNNRYVTPNKAGYTLQDFQDVYEKIYGNYKDKGLNVYLIGSEDYLNKNTCPTATTDNLHMTRITNGEFGAYMAREFVDKGMLK